MRLELPNGAHMTIGDDNPMAVKIRQGYDWEVKDGELKIKTTKKNYDLESFIIKLKAGTTNPKEVEEFLLECMIPLLYK